MDKKDTVQWQKNGAEWYLLKDTASLQSIIGDREGVYVIWEHEDVFNIIRVGKGQIFNRITTHHHGEKGKPQIFKHEGVMVTWAYIPNGHHVRQKNAECYLADRLNPEFGEYDDIVDHDYSINLPDGFDMELFYKRMIRNFNHRETIILNHNIGTSTLTIKNGDRGMVGLLRTDEYHGTEHFLKIPGDKGFVVPQLNPDEFTAPSKDEVLNVAIRLLIEAGVIPSSLSEG